MDQQDLSNSFLVVIARRSRGYCPVKDAFTGQGLLVICWVLGYLLLVIGYCAAGPRLLVIWALRS